MSLRRHLSNRHVLLHCHIYKNAGSSIDRLLWESFGDGFAVLDTLPGHDTIGPLSLKNYLAENTHIKAVSSHRIHPPFSLARTLPIVMLRHPVDRARSAYRFARHNTDMPDHPIARERSLAGYIEWSLAARGEGAILRDHQVQHLSHAAFRSHDPARWRATQADLDGAKNVLAALPAFGLVRRFTESCRLFNATYRPKLPALHLTSWAENTTSDPAMAEVEAVSEARRDMGQDAYQALCEANTLDLNLYDFAARLFADRLAYLDRPFARITAPLRLLAGRVRQRLAEPHLYPAGPIQGPGSGRHPTEPAYVRLPYAPSRL